MSSVKGPKCFSKLIFDYYHYGHLGKYYCPKCEYKRSVDYEATDVDLDNSSMKINGSFIHLNKNVFFAAYYTLAAYTLCRTLNLEEEKILNAININVMDSKRIKTILLNNREVEMIESKNENNLSYLQSLYYINSYKQSKTIILGFENVSRRYTYNDLSWLYDVDFSVLDTTNVERIFCIGRFRFDVAARLINAKIDKDKLILVDDVNHIVKLINENTRGKIFTMVCFDMTEILKKLILSGGSDEN